MKIKKKILLSLMYKYAKVINIYLAKFIIIMGYIAYIFIYNVLYN